MNFKNLIKKGLIGALTLTMLTSVAFAENNGYTNFTKVNDYSKSGFTDVPSGQWYADQVKFGYEMGLLSGKGAGKFDPMGNVTLAEAMVLASRVHSKFYGNTINAVSGGEWWTQYAEYCYSNGIVTKAYMSKFKPASTLATREQMAYIFASIIPNLTVTLPSAVPPDVTNFVGGISRDSQGNWIEKKPSAGQSEFYDQIVALYKAGVIGGSDSKGTFYPANNITRAETVTILNKIVDPTRRKGYTSGGSTTTPTTPTESIDYSLNNQFGADPALQYGSTKIAFSTRPIITDISNGLWDEYPLEEVLQAIGAKLGTRNSQGYWDKFTWNGQDYKFEQTSNGGRNVVQLTDPNGSIIIDDIWALQENGIWFIDAQGLQTLSSNFLVNKYAHVVNGSSFNSPSVATRYSNNTSAYSDVPLSAYLNRDNIWLSDAGYTAIKDFATQAIAGKSSTDDKARAIANAVVSKLAPVDGYTGSSAEDLAYKVLQAGKGLCGEYAMLTANAMRTVGIPARYVYGMGHGGAHAWMEYYNGSKWVKVDTVWMERDASTYFDFSNTTITSDNYTVTNILIKY